MLHNTAPLAIGGLTIAGIVIDNEWVFVITMLLVCATCTINMINIVRNCDTRNKRLKLLSERRIKRDANSSGAR